LQEVNEIDVVGCNQEGDLTHAVAVVVADGSVILMDQLAITIYIKNELKTFSHIHHIPCTAPLQRHSGGVSHSACQQNAKRG
jgi:hypothetical protein